MTDAELQAIRARCDAATAGPWEASSDTRSGIYWSFRVSSPDNTRISGVCTDRPDLNYPAHIAQNGLWPRDEGENAPSIRSDFEFIAHARTDVPALLAEVDRLKENLKEARGLVPHGLRHLVRE